LSLRGVSIARYFLQPTGTISGVVEGRTGRRVFPDLVVQHQLIVDTKTIDRLTDHERQTLNYLRITALPVGIILNFKHPRLEWERLMLTNEPELDGETKELIL
jgi:hypothetical protein